MDRMREQLDACKKWGKECRVEWGVQPSREIVGVVSEVRNGLVKFTVTSKGTWEIPFDDIVEIYHPILVENHEGTFQIMKGPIC